MNGRCFILFLIYTDYQSTKKEKRKGGKEEQRERKLYFIYNQGTNQIGSLAGAKRDYKQVQTPNIVSFLIPGYEPI
jgi:hypothetical protein